MSIQYSVTRFGDLWKFLVTNFLTKVAQIYKRSWDYFEKPHSKEKTVLATSWVTFGNIWAILFQHSVTLIQFTVPGFELTTFSYESPPLTTRPGFPPFFMKCLKIIFRRWNIGKKLLFFGRKKRILEMPKINSGHVLLRFQVGLSKIIIIALMYNIHVSKVLSFFQEAVVSRKGVFFKVYNKWVNMFVFLKWAMHCLFFSLPCFLAGKILQKKL